MASCLVSNCLSLPPKCTVPRSRVHGRWSVHRVHFCKLSLAIEKKKAFPFYFCPVLQLRAYKQRKRLSSQQGDKVPHTKNYYIYIILWNFTFNFILIMQNEREHHCVHLFCCHLCLRGGGTLYSTNQISLVMCIHGEGKEKLKCIHLGANKYRVTHNLEYRKKKVE